MIVRTAAIALALSVLAVGSAEARPEWVRCASEGGYCRVPFPTIVRYGAEGRYAEVRTGDGVPCDNGAFGDPARGARKACWFLARDRGGWAPPPPPPPPRDWYPCAREGEYCEVRGEAVVRYGARDRYVVRRVRGGIGCDNGSFGGDPIPGVRKACFAR